MAYGHLLPRSPPPSTHARIQEIFFFYVVLCSPLHRLSFVKISADLKKKRATAFPHDKLKDFMTSRLYSPGFFLNLHADWNIFNSSCTSFASLQVWSKPRWRLSSLFHSPNKSQTVHLVRIVSENQNSRLTLTRLCQSPDICFHAQVVFGFWFFTDIFILMSGRAHWNAGEGV